MPEFPSIRYPGDGLDLRRPATTSVPQNVIDLTDDFDFQPAGSSSSAARVPSRRSRRQRDDESTRATVDSSSETSEVEFLEARSITSHQPDQSETRRLGASALAQERRSRRPPVPQYSSTDSAFAVGNWPAFLQDMRPPQRSHHPAHQTVRRFHHLLQPPAHMQGGQGAEILLPGDLDFVTTGFHIGENALARPPQPAPPTYDAPAPPREGFTRSPGEGDVLVCPNCEEELGIGVDKVKREVWVAKTCGHVRNYMRT
ncbi:MAG: hypothetical protein Q9174_000862 [Haloplaca sp. 1 TL-2023]